MHCLAYHSTHATSPELSVSLIISSCSDANGRSPQLLYSLTASDATAIPILQYESHTLGMLCSDVSFSAYLFGGVNSTDGQYTGTVVSLDPNGLNVATLQIPRKDAAGGCGSKSCTFVGGWYATSRLQRCLIRYCDRDLNFPMQEPSRSRGRCGCAVASNTAA